MTSKPWYAGEHQDALFYLLIAVFIVELAVGGIAFFYGIIHAKPEAIDGPPIAQFPWLAWALAAVLSPVALLLIVHLAGSWLSKALKNDDQEKSSDTQANQNKEELPAGMRRFYAAVRQAPTIVLLSAILLIGALLFFMDGALSTLRQLGIALLPYFPWLAGCGAALLGTCFFVHAFMVYKQRKLENEYAWRREVLEKTGLVLVDKASLPLPQNEEQKALLYPDGLPPNQILDVDALPRALDQTDQNKN